MRENLTTFLPLLKKHEGGYVDHPKDPGGCTNMGITLATYRHHINSKGTCEDLKELTWEEAEEIYESTYWREVWGDDLPHGVDVSVFDMGVNAGPRRAVKLLQDVLGVAQDGIVGPNTLTACEAYGQSPLVNDYAVRRIKFYRGLRGWSVFGKGWARRTEETRVLALECPVTIAEPVQPPEPERPAPVETPVHLLIAKRVTVSEATNNDHAGVKIAQALLAAHGYNAGEIDGIAGPKFTSAIETFQSDHDLGITGFCDYPTWALLELVNSDDRR